MSGFGYMARGYNNFRRESRREDIQDEQRERTTDSYEYEKGLRPLKEEALRADIEAKKANGVGLGLNNKLKQNDVDRLPTTNATTDKKTELGLKALKQETDQNDIESDFLRQGLEDKQTLTQQQIKSNQMSQSMIGEKWDEEKNAWSDKARILASTATNAELQTLIAEIDLDNARLVQGVKSAETETALMGNLTKQQALVYKLMVNGESKMAADSLNRNKFNDIDTAADIFIDDKTGDAIILDASGEELKRITKEQMDGFARLFDENTTKKDTYQQDSTGKYFKVRGNTASPVTTPDGEQLVGGLPKGSGKSSAGAVSDKKSFQISIKYGDGKVEEKNWTKAEAQKHYEQKYSLIPSEQLDQLMLSDPKAWKSALQENNAAREGIPKLEEWLGDVMSNGIQLGGGGLPRKEVADDDGSNDAFFEGLK